MFLRNGSNPDQFHSGLAKTARVEDFRKSESARSFVNRLFNELQKAPPVSRQGSSVIIIVSDQNLKPAPIP
ncbi:hypothetical protein SPHINGOR109_11107 [Sphingorhabdus sp. 109]|jgi:hypothetical protein|nr:hypothetical protein SPHINGOR109_11107 [Sphingorhabdus sp. 109]